MFNDRAAQKGPPIRNHQTTLFQSESPSLPSLSFRAEPTAPSPLLVQEAFDRAEKVLRVYSRHTDVDALCAAVRYQVTPSFLINTLKAGPDTTPERLLVRGARYSKIDWASNAWAVEGGISRRHLAGSRANAQGLIYIKEAASMLPPELAGIQPTDRVLDVCAAPGGKTLQALMKLGPTGALAANELRSDRREDMRRNLSEHGATIDKRVAIFDYDAANLPSSWSKFFNVVLCDVPCTGLGILQRNPEAIFKHADFETTSLPYLQEKILIRALDVAKVGGTVVYSTCSLTISENERVIDRVLDKFGSSVSVVDPLKSLSFTNKRWDLTRAVEDSLKVQDVERLRFRFPSVRIWPHQFDAMGFFVCVLRRDS